MSNETNPTPAPLTTTPTKTKTKWWWISALITVIGAAIAGFWPGGEAKQPQQPDMPLTIVYSALQTNWEATVSSSHDPRLPVTVLTMTNGTLATNIMNLNVRRAEIYRTSLLGFRKLDGGILPVAQAVVVAGRISQTNGVDFVSFTEFSTNK